MARAHSELRPEDITAIIDSREQMPLELSLKHEMGTLSTADYSIKGLENDIAIERKSLSDLIGCVGQSRDRFEREVQRLLAFRTKAVVVESSWANLELGQWRGSITPNVAIGSVLGWVAQGIPFIMAGTRENAGRMVSRILFIAARRRFRELQSFHDCLKIQPSASPIAEPQRKTLPV